MQRHETVIGKMLVGKRRILASDLQIIARYVGQTPPSILTSAGTFGVAGQAPSVSAVLRTSGSIGTSWVESKTESDEALNERSSSASAIIDDRFPVETQTAYSLADFSVYGLGFQGLTHVVTVPWKEFRLRPLNGDLSVLRLERGGLVAYSLARWKDGSWQVVHGAAAAAATGQMVGLVIGIQTRLS
jgi:hypothetical protein